MERGGHDQERSARVDLTRRQALRVLGGGAVGAGVARVAYEYTGFGIVAGTNLTEQSLGPLARRRLGPSPFTLRVRGHELTFDGEVVERHDKAGERVAAVSITDGEPGVSEDPGEPAAALAADLGAIEADEFAFEFTGVEGFFQRLRGGRTRPFTVAALRGDGFRRPDPETVRAFTGVGPADPRSLVTGLADAFGGHAHFDYARYVAGLVQEYLLLGTIPVEKPFREPTHFEAMLDGTSGLYCYEYAFRSVEAFHAVPPHRQSVPVFGALVLDDRHNHAYTALASVVREDGDLRVPMTFVDYYYSTLFDNVDLQWALGDGIGAYDEHHRASGIHYSTP
ncbi:hypothetical protein ACFO0N_14260 [Halobium salinum]|uniref:Uncharacterized protein n=1 Tax=Halobium salinum TaxID=1364940 RepID=A0ABD5PEB5_9EURY|nr:hypothetical protein [Halobium salinum]